MIVYAGGALRSMFVVLLKVLFFLFVKLLFSVLLEFVNQSFERCRKMRIIIQFRGRRRIMIVLAAACWSSGLSLSLTFLRPVVRKWSYQFVYNEYVIWLWCSRTRVDVGLTVEILLCSVTRISLFKFNSVVKSLVSDFYPYTKCSCRRFLRRYRHANFIREH